MARIIGIDLGSYSVKLCLVERSLGEFKLCGFYELPLVAGDVLTKEQAQSAALSKFFGENKLQYDFAVTAIPGQNVAIRSLELPFTKRQKIEQVIPLEIEDYIPFEGEDILHDFHLVESLGATSRVLVPYLKSELMGNFLKALASANVDPRYVGIDSFELSNLVLVNALPSVGNYVLLDIGHTKSSLVYMRGHKLRGVRTLNVAGHHFTQMIAQLLGCNFNDAEDFKHKRGIVHVNPQMVETPIQQALLKAADDLFFEIKQTLFSWYEQGEAPIDALFLCGGGSRISGLDQYFSYRLRVNVSPIDVLLDEYTRLPEKDWVRPVVPPSFALTLKGMYPGKANGINFRTGEFAFKQDMEQLSGSFVNIAAMIMVVVLLGFLHFATSYYLYSARVNKLNAEVEKLVKTNIGDLPDSKNKSKDSKNKSKVAASEVLSQLSGKIKTMEARLAKVETGNTPSAYEILRRISALMPARSELKLDVWELSINAGHVVMQADTESSSMIAKVQSALQNEKSFQNILKGDENKTATGIRFKLSFDVSDDAKVTSN